MKRHLIVCVGMLLLSLLAEAKNYTVKADGGGNFTTIQACVDTMANGDTCVVYSGTYGENVAITDGGGGAYKTVQANGSDLVYVLSVTVGSHNKVINLHIQNPSFPNASFCVTIGNTATDTYITGNTMYACAGVRSAKALGTPSYIYLQNNTISYPCTTDVLKDPCTPAVTVNGDHWLVEGNDISHVADWITLNGSHQVIRNNMLHDSYGRDPLGTLSTHECNPSLTNTTATISGTSVTQTGGSDFSLFFPGAWVSIGATRYTVSAVNSSTSVTLAIAPGDGTGVPIGGGQGGNCHIDGVQSEPSVPTQFNLIEGNTLFNNFGSDGHSFLAQGDVCGGNCHDLIIRFNIAAHIGSGGIINDNARKSSVNPGFYAVKSYNNSWVDTSNYPGSINFGITNAFTFWSTNGANINDLFYFPESLSSYSPYICGERKPSDTCSTFVARNNLVWCTGSTCNVHGQIYSQGNFTDNPGNIHADPKFADYRAPDLHLSTSSAAIGSGSYLTTVAAEDSGSGTTLLVNNAGFFQDGYGLSGVQADRIRIGTSTVVQITSIDYATNTLKIAKSITRSPGEQIYLFSDSNGRVVLFGNAPNIGAVPTAGEEAPAPPTGLTVQVT